MCTYIRLLIYIRFFFSLVIVCVRFHSIGKVPKTLENQAYNFKFKPSPSLAHILYSMSSRGQAQLGFPICSEASQALKARHKNLDMKSWSLEQARAAWGLTESVVWPINTTKYTESILNFQVEWLDSWFIDSITSWQMKLPSKLRFVPKVNKKKSWSSQRVRIEALI